MLTLNYIELHTAFYIAVFAFTVRCVLMQYGEILFFYTQFLEKLPAGIAKPFGLCDKCFAGQIALWVYLIAEIDNYNLIIHCFFITFSIFLTLLLGLVVGILKRFNQA